MHTRVPKRSAVRFRAGRSGPQIVSVARHWVSRYVEQRTDFDDITAVAAELIANAHNHTRSAAGSFTVELLIGLDELTLIVHDDGATSPPHRRDHDEHTTHGRGLAIVDALASAWGIDGNEHSRSVWATFGGR